MCTAPGSLKGDLSYFTARCEMPWSYMSPQLHTFHQHLIIAELYDNLDSTTALVFTDAEQPSLAPSDSSLVDSWVLAVACFLQTWTCWFCALQLFSPSLQLIFYFHLWCIWSKNYFSICKFSNVCIYGFWVSLKKYIFLYSQALLSKSIYHLSV